MLRRYINTRPFIIYNDVLFCDENVQILHPKSPRGILVFHAFEFYNVVEQGLFPSSKYPFDFGLDVVHDEIFFRAPYKKKISSSNQLFDYFDDNIIDYYQNLVVLRVCLYNTNVFSSEIRSFENFGPLKGRELINQSKKSMIQYMNQIEENEKKLEELANKEHMYHLFTGEVVENNQHLRFNPNFSYLPINTNSEVLVKVDHIPPEWFVECYWDGKKVVNFN